MNGIKAIAKREFTAYFGQPLAYIVLLLFVGLLALPSLVFGNVLMETHASMRYIFFWIAASFVFFVFSSLAPRRGLSVVPAHRHHHPS